MPPTATAPSDLEPTAGAPKADPPMLATMARFLPYLWPADAPMLRVRIAAALSLVLISKAVQISMAFLLAGAIGKMQPGMQPAYTLAVALVLSYAGARFAAVVFDNIRNVVFERVGQTATRMLAEHVFVHLHRLSMRFHLARRTGAVTKVIERGTKSIDVMLYFLLFNIAPTVIELIAVTVIFWYNFGVGLALATLMMVATYIIFTRRITDWRNALRQEMNDLDTATVSRSVDSLLNYETVKYFNAEDREASHYARVVRRYAAAAVKSENSLAWLNIGQSLITNIMLGGALAYCVWGWSTGRFAAQDVILINGLLSQLFRPLDLLGMVYRTIRQGIIDMAAMFDLIDTPAEVRDAPGAYALAVTSGAVEFENVHFGYDPDRQILNGLSFAVPPGGTLAIVGPSGAGKSTIARLLFRFYDVTSGRILIDGHDIARVTQASLRSQIGIVPQDSVLFNDSIGYNIAYGRDGATTADVAAAVQGSALEDFIAALPEGLETQVGERGLKLSGGEKQRVAIARTLVKNPPILILDEATSALDSRTEAAIQDTLNAIAENRTSIIVAHRLSTIVHADQIIVLDAGEVRERGTHRSLLAKTGLYADMWARQQAEEDDIPVS